MKKFLLALACAATASVSVSAQQAAMYAPVGDAINAERNDTKRVAQHNEDREKPQEGSKRVCNFEAITGSRLKTTRVCRYVAVEAKKPVSSEGESRAERDEKQEPMSPTPSQIER